MTAAVALAAGQAIRTYRTRSSARRLHSTATPSALLLSGGGNLSFFHLGVIKVLREQGLLPRILSGASAGSMIAALVGTRTDRELRKLDEDELAFIGFSEKKPDQPYTSEMVEASIAEVLPDVTFAEAAEISGRDINISLAAPSGGGIVCGPKSTPDVLVRDAVRASCAVPFVFDPVVVHERRNGRITPFRSGQAWVDGSLYADVPGHHIRRLYGVRHTIVSLVNPAVRPFFGDESSPGRVRGMMLDAARSAALGFAQLGRLTAGAVPKARALFDTAYRVIEQRYSGDLVLTPSRRFVMTEVLDHPSSDLVLRLSADGAARTRARLDDVRAMLQGPPVPAPSFTAMALS